MELGSQRCSVRTDLWAKSLTAMGVSVLLKRPEVRGARSEDTIGVEVLVDEVVETKMRRGPSTAGKSTVEPLFGAVGRVLGGSTPAASPEGCQPS